jgi:hypothetical protein
VKDNSSVGNEDNVNNGNNNSIALGHSRNYRRNNSGQRTGYSGAQTTAAPVTWQPIKMQSSIKRTQYNNLYEVVTRK